MSGKAYGQRFAIIPDGILDAPISSNAFRLWATLQRHSDVLGHCYPSLKRLAAIMGVSEDTIRRAKNELVDAGFVVAKERYDDGGRRTSDDLFLRGAPSRSAGGDPSKSARVNSKAVELDPEEPKVVVHLQNSTPPPPAPIPTGPLVDHVQRLREKARNG